MLINSFRLLSWKVTESFPKDLSVSILKQLRDLFFYMLKRNNVSWESSFNCWNYFQWAISSKKLSLFYILPCSFSSIPCFGKWYHCPQSTNASSQWSPKFSSVFLFNLSFYYPYSVSWSLWHSRQNKLFICMIISFFMVSLPPSFYLLLLSRKLLLIYEISAQQLPFPWSLFWFSIAISLI